MKKVFLKSHIKQVNVPENFGLVTFSPPGAHQQKNNKMCALVQVQLIWPLPFAKKQVQNIYNH